MFPAASKALFAVTVEYLTTRPVSSVLLFEFCVVDRVKLTPLPRDMLDGGAFKFIVTPQTVIL